MHALRIFIMHLNLGWNRAFFLKLLLYMCACSKTKKEISIITNNKTSDLHTHANMHAHTKTHAQTCIYPKHTAKKLLKFMT